jgi:predicted Zn-dependent peptidase
MRKMKFVYALFLSASLLIVGEAIRPAVATAADGGGNPAPDTAAPFRIPIKQVTLKNGLRVILSEDHTAPTYSICIDYNVGSRNERPGRTGFAHLFEHMMYQGSENVGKGEMNMLVQNNGGGMNGTTDKDRTVYFETLPANQLDLGFFMESDRMRALAINQANLDNQRNAVQEERRLRVDNQPYGKTFEKVDDLAYENPAYKHSVIGSMEDLNAASVADVAGFFKTYYAPNNAVLVLVGDFKSDEALAKIEKYFGGIPRQPDGPPVDMNESPQTAERRATLEDALARTPRLDIAYKITPGYTADWYALDVVGDVLTNGQSSRLYQELVKDKSMVTGVFGGAGNDRGPALFRLIASVKPGVSPADVEKAIEADIERIQKDGITADELTKTILRDRVTHIQGLQGTLNRAFSIGEFAVNFNDPEMINKGDAAYAKVTLADVKRVAQKYLTPNNRTVVITMPKAAAPAGAGQ